MYLAQLAANEQDHWSRFEIPAERQDFVPDSGDEVFSKWYFGTVRSRPSWQIEESDDDDE